MSSFVLHANEALSIQAIGQGAAFARGQLECYLKRVLGKSNLGAAGESAASQEIKSIHLSIDSEHPLSDEGYRFAISDTSLTIVGGGQLGLIYGVFAFLRDGCGCQFSGLAPDGEWIPLLASVRLEDDGLPHEPVLAYRGLQFTTLELLDRQAARLDWMLKNGMNQVLIRFNPDEDEADEVDPQSGMRHAGLGSEGHRMTSRYVDEYFLPLVRERGLKLDISHHNLRCWLPPRKWVDSHPEWYSLTNGKRASGLRQLCLCTSNEAAIQELIATLDRYLVAHPGTQRIGVIPEDGIGMCECASCVAMDEDPSHATRPWQGKLHPDSMNPSKATRYALLLNRVAEALRAKHPGVIVVGAAYVDLALPAVNVAYADNIEIWLAVYWRDGARPLRLENTSPINRRYFEYIQDWSRQLSGRVYLYEYYMGMNAQHSLPYPMSRVIVQDWQAMNGDVRGATIQCLTCLHEAYGLNLLTFARLGWQRNVDHDQVLADWLLGMFGNAGRAIAPIFERWLAAVDSIGSGAVAGNDPNAAFLQDGELMPNARNIVCLLEHTPRQWLADQIRQARSEAASPREARQIDRLEHYLSYCHAAAALVLALDDGHPQEIAASLEKTVKHANHALAQGWIAPAHVVRWQRMARPRFVTEHAQ